MSYDNLIIKIIIKEIQSSTERCLFLLPQTSMKENTVTFISYQNQTLKSNDLRFDTRNKQTQNETL